MAKKIAKTLTDCAYTVIEVVPWLISLWRRKKNLKKPGVTTGREYRKIDSIQPGEYRNAT